MKNVQSLTLPPLRYSRRGWRIAVAALAPCLATCLVLPSAAQTPPAAKPAVAPVSAVPAPPAVSDNSAPPAPGDNVRYGYTIHQTLELGGHVAGQSGSSAVYDTMVNLHSGPRILNEFLEMRAVDPARSKLFDTLSTSSFGYAGDPNSVSMLNVARGKIYDFRGSFRRDRQYFDYDLLANPLIPPASTPFDPVLSSPHLFNTVRRNTDLNLTVAPLSPVSVRFGWNHNISEGPSFSTVHFGTEALLTQNWRNATDSWTGGIDWKPFRLTTISFDQFVSNYKGDTTWGLGALNYQLSNGTPVSLGIDISSVWKTPCAAPLTGTGAVNPTCNAYLSYSRVAPVRTLIPSEQLRFQSAAIPHFTFNGRLLYSGGNSRLSNFNETFNGLETRTGLRQSVITGSASTERVNVNGDLSMAWQIAPKIAATDVFNFWDFRMPGTNSFTEIDSPGSSLLTPPGPPGAPVTTPDYQYINQKTKTNTFLVAWDATGRARLSLGYRYRSRIITDAGGDFIPIHENWGIFGAALRPTPQWRVNFDADAMYADNAFTRISPRHQEHYQFRTNYKPNAWLAFSGTINDHEASDNVQTVNHVEHNRDFSFGATIAPDEKWSLDLNYGFDSVYSTTVECYTSSAPPTTAGVAPDVCAAAGTPNASTGYYNSPTQFGAFGFTVSPVKRVHLNGGYRISAVDGSSDLINIRQVAGSLQSRYQSPYVRVAFDLAKNWSWKGDYNYYGYGEQSPVGPTAPRNFHGNVGTLAVNYAF
jgi:hypothetical protein